MYPQRELNRLAAHKAILRRNIALRRMECAHAAAQVVHPLQWVDRFLATWRRIPPLARMAAAPIGLFAARSFFPRIRLLMPLLRWGPALVYTLRGMGSSRATAP